MGSIANVTEQTRRAVSSLIGAGADIIENSEKTVATLSHNALDVMTDAWSGIELVNITLHHAHGKVAVASADTFLTWVETNDTAMIQKLSGARARVLSHLAISIDIDMPFAELGERHFNLSHSFIDFLAEAKLLLTGYIVLRWLIREVRFHARWSNPIWEVYGSSLDEPTEQVKTRIEDVLSAMPSPYDTVWTWQRKCRTPCHQ